MEGRDIGSAFSYTPTSFHDASPTWSAPPQRKAIRSDCGADQRILARALPSSSGERTHRQLNLTIVGVAARSPGD